MLLLDVVFKANNLKYNNISLKTASQNRIFLRKRPFTREFAKELPFGRERSLLRRWSEEIPVKNDSIGVKLFPISNKK